MAQLFYGSGTALEFLLLCLLLRGPVRRYPVFSVYILERFAADLCLAFTYRSHGRASSLYRDVYWTAEVITALLLFLVMITFTYEALRGNPLRAMAGKIFGAIAIITLTIPFLLLHSRVFSYRWFNTTDQMLNFGAAIMNLVLWTALLTNKRRSPQLLTISMGLGVAATSAAMTWGARLWVSDAHRWPIDTFAILIYTGSLALWCWVFRPPQSRGLLSRASCRPPVSDY
jgi:hypothetical protein